MNEACHPSSGPVFPLFVAFQIVSYSAGIAKYLFEKVTFSLENK
jgi:hypothetical protein